MPYFFYQRENDQRYIYKQVSGIALFGYKQGLVYHGIKSELERAFEQKRGLLWVRSAADVLAARGYEPLRNAVVVDLDPKRVDGILMGVVCGIAGHTDRTWTPFMLLMRLIEKSASAAEKIELDFDEAQQRCCTVLYAQEGGWDLQKRQYTRPGGRGITSPILGHVAFNHFMKTGLEWIENGKITTETRQEC